MEGVQGGLDKPSRDRKGVAPSDLCGYVTEAGDRAKRLQLAACGVIRVEPGSTLRGNGSDLLSRWRNWQDWHVGAGKEAWFAVTEAVFD